MPDAISGTEIIVKITGYIVNQVDGRAWNSEAVGSNPTIQTQSRFCINTCKEKYYVLLLV